MNPGRTAQELKCILSVLILSGYVSCPRRRMFWETFITISWLTPATGTGLSLSSTCTLQMIATWTGVTALPRSDPSSPA